MDLKIAGFYKENGYVGMPSMYDYISLERPVKRKLSRHVYRYLNNGVCLTSAMGKSIFNDEYFYVEAWVTDGKWIWNTSMIYYYENHGVDLPKDFENYINEKSLAFAIFFRLKNFIFRNKLAERIDSYFTNRLKEQGVPPQKPSN